jgi:hypothetical protein
MRVWSPITQPQMEQLLRDQLALCNNEERAAFERIKIPLRPTPFQRVGKIEHVFAVGQHDSALLIFDDVEQGFEWCQLDSDGVIRSYRCSQAGLQARLYELSHHDRT